ncbi:thermonuclease family protein [Heyndrickxia oleronia]|uniref:thermonuclease family protein n=1 Tax=Heyndrickxia oleronia TaxID=38875 RepID=UPI003F28636B
MDNLFLLLCLISFVCIFLGILMPKRFVFWSNKKTRKSAGLVYVVLTIVFFILFGMTVPPSQQASTSDVKTNETTKVKKVETVNKKDTEKVEKINNTSTQNDKASSKIATSQSTNTIEDSKKNRIPVTLTKTVDGDTIKVMYKGKEETVRYLLIDTPESKKPNTCVQPYAEKASNRNKQLVNSGNLTLEFEKSERDKYDRLLAYVFVNGISVQETLLKEGYARVAYIYEPPYKYLSKYEKAEDIAQQKHTNIWSQSGLVTESGFVGCASKAVADSSTKSNSNTNKNSVATTTTPKPSNNTGNSNAFQNDPSDDQESNTSCKGKIKGNANSKIYHVPGGAYYDKTQDNIVWFCSASDAEAAGYRASKR